MTRRFFLAVAFVFLASFSLSTTGCGVEPNASMSAALMLGIGAAAYGAYYYLTSESAAQTAVIVVNNTGRPIKLWIDGELWGTVSTGATVTIAIAPGTYALGAGENTPDTTTSQTIAEGTAFTWTLVPAT